MQPALLARVSHFTHREAGGTAHVGPVPHVWDKGLPALPGLCVLPVLLVGFPWGWRDDPGRGQPPSCMSGAGGGRD